MLTIVVVIISVTVVSVAALTGVFNLAQDQVTASQHAVRQVISAEIDNRLDASVRVVNRASESTVDSSTGAVDREALAAHFESGIEYIDMLVVAELNGGAVGTFPPFDVPENVSDLMRSGIGVSDTPTFWYSGSGAQAELWVARSLEGFEGRLCVLARLRTSFLTLLVEEFSIPDSRVVAILNESDSILFAPPNEGGLIPLELSYTPSSDREASGSLEGESVSGEVVWGQYSDLGGHPGLDWHVSVIEPRSAVLNSTRMALTPAVLALLFSGLLSILLVTVFSRRLVKPLRTLEAHALEAVSGAYVDPIHSDRGDEVGRLADAFNAIALRLNALQDLSQLLASSSSADQVLDGILSTMGHIVGSSNIEVLLVDEFRANLIVARSRGLLATEERVIPLRQKTWLAQALEADAPTAFTGKRSELGVGIPGVASDASVSGLVTPLRVGTQPLGLIIVVNEGVREFTVAEMEMIRTFSAQAALAVHNARLFEIESASRREAEAMRTVAEVLANPLETERAFDAVMRLAQRLFDVRQATIAFRDRSTLGIGPAADVQAERSLLRAWDAAWSLGDGDLVMRVSPGDHPSIDRYLDGIPAEQALFVTVVRGGNPEAVVSLATDQPDRSFSDQERRLAYALGKQLALAVDNSFHYAEARTRAANLETVFRISQAVSSSLQIKVVLNRVLDVVQKIFAADTVSLMQYDEGNRRIETVMARGVISPEMLHFSCVPGEDVPGTVFSSGDPQKIDDITGADTPLAVAAGGQGLRSMLSVPLMARGRSIGVLTVFASSLLAYSNEDMGLLHTFASQAALAIDTADMYGREHHVASVLQHSILPKNLPDYPEIESSSVYLAAGDEAEIGGDYFDLFKDNAGRIFMAIGDVCGKGVEAATKTSMIKYMVRGLVAAGLGPAAAMTQVNRAVAESGSTSDIVTLWLGVIDLKEQTLCYADGGHPPAIVRRGDGAVERLETTGALLGAFLEAEYGEIELSFAPDDIVVLYTDGVTEARRGNKFFGEGRVRRAVGAGGTANEVVDRLLGALDRYVPGTLRDDAAILAVRVRTADE